MYRNRTTVGLSKEDPEAKLEERTGIIRKTPGKEEYCVKSPKNPDWNGGCYKSKEKAKNRLKQVEYFKHEGAQDWRTDFSLHPLVRNLLVACERICNDSAPSNAAFQQAIRSAHEIAQNTDGSVLAGITYIQVASQNGETTRL